MQAARRFLQIETQMNESIAALSGHTAGLLRLGLPQQRADELLPQVLAEFQSVYPEVCVQAVSLPNDELERKLLGSELDMALGFPAKPKTKSLNISSSRRTKSCCSPVAKPGSPSAFLPVQPSV